MATLADVLHTIVDHLPTWGNGTEAQQLHSLVDEVLTDVAADLETPAT
jgi:hypothetical protein